MGFHNKAAAPGIEDIAAEATIGMFRIYPAKGNMQTPERLNDNDTGSGVATTSINTYCEVWFGDLVKIKRWRQFGHIAQGTDGRWKIQYWNVVTNEWTDWVTDIPTLPTATWSDLATEEEVVTTKVRWVATTISSPGNENFCNELEIYY
ncbi:hypothetical protein ES705_44882 [subsurface metagenome]